MILSVTISIFIENSIILVNLSRTDISSDFLIAFYHLDVGLMVVGKLKNFSLYKLQNILFNNSKPFKNMFKMKQLYYLPHLIE